MASYAVASGERGVHAKALVANTVDTVTFAVDCVAVEVMNETGTAAISFTTDGTTPTVAGNNTYYLPAAVGAIQVEPDVGGVTVIKLISSGTPSYGVTQA